MTVREMHYDFKQKLNRIDSQKYRDLYVPEIDWRLNEAQEVFVKIIAEPRMKSELGFEVNERTINDIRTIVINQTPEAGDCSVPTEYGSNSYLSILPEDYWFFVRGNVVVSKNNCTDITMAVKEIQHDDEAELSPFDKSSFEWRISNMRFIKQGIRLFTDGTFSINLLCMDYIKEPQLIQNAQDWDGGTYTTLDGTVLTGSQDCELPAMVHREIVDLAVLITAGDLNLPDYPLKANKMRLTQ